MIDIGVPGVDSLQIQIRKGVELLNTTDVPDLLNCDLPFSFWMSWGGNTLQVFYSLIDIYALQLVWQNKFCTFILYM